MATRAPDPKDLFVFEPIDRWVRALRDGGTIADSRHPLIVWPGEGQKALYAFPEDDVRADALPEEGVHRWPDDDDLEGYVGVEFGAADEWWEEDERLFLGPRDLFHRVDAQPSSRRARVEVDGEVVAESGRPVLLFETKYPVRVYVPREDVDMGRLERTDTTSGCPYKGGAVYFAVDGTPDLAFSYEQPLRESAPVEGYLCFLGDGVTTTLDGEEV